MAICSHNAEESSRLEAELCNAIEILEFALRLRMYGEEELTGTWKQWDSACEAFLRQYPRPTIRKNYVGYNETPTKGFTMSEQNQDETVTVNVTDEIPTMEPQTRSKVKKGVAIGVFAAGALLLIDDQVKRFRNRKNVVVTVTDKDESDTSDDS